MNGKIILASVPLVLGMAAVGLQQVTTHDAVSYHYDIQAVLSRLGVFPGLGLFHSRYGFLSSWFTLPALFNHGPLEGRMTSSAASYMNLLIAGQVAWAFYGALTRTLKPEDGLSALGLSLAMFFPLLFNVSATASPDAPVALLTVICFWTLFPRTTRSPMLPVLFAALAVTVKLSALPLVAVTGVMGLLRVERPVKWFFQAGAMCGLVFLPWVANQILITGWPFYPLGFRLPLPWSLSHATRTVETQAVKANAPWGRGENWDFLQVVGEYFSEDATRIFALAHVLLGCAGLGYLWIRRKSVRAPVSPLSLGWLGCLFWFFTTAHPRFGWGYLGLTALTGAFAFPFHRCNLPAPSPSRARAAAVVFSLVIFAVPTLTIPTRTQRMVRNAQREGTLEPPGPLLLRPPLAPHIYYERTPYRVVPRTVETVERDWLPLEARPLYYRLDPRNELVPRKPEKGIRGGVAPIEDPRTYSEYHRNL